MEYDIFISYSRKDNRPVPESHPCGWVTAIRDQIAADHQRFSTEPLRIFLDTGEIHDMDDWRHRILGALKQSKILLVCLSPSYLESDNCRWEWDEYLRRQVHQLMGSESVATVYFVEVPGSDEQANARWLEEVQRGNFTDVRPWYPEGPLALQREEVRKRMEALGASLWERIQRARRAVAAPGNLRRQNPHFLGRREELRRLHEDLTKGAVGVVTALHGVGGQGKTELAVAYAHGFADCYPGGLWSLGAEGKKELLPLIGELAFEPRLGFTPTEEQKNDGVLLGKAVLEHLRQRAEAVKETDPDRDAAVLILLDNVSEPELLSLPQLATLPSGPGGGWLRVVATTRLGIAPVRGQLSLLAVDALDEETALAVIREHQPPRDASGRIVPDQSQGEPAFASEDEEAAAREIARDLGGFTLAVEQVGVFLGLHPEVSPAAFLAMLRERGLASVDALAGDPDVGSQMLTQSRQLGLILDATLQTLEPAAVTALRFAALLPPDTVPWPWLRELTVGRHPEMGEDRGFGVNGWQAVRRRLEGSRLLTPGDDIEIGRLHRLVGAHIAKDVGPAHRETLDGLLSRRANEVYEMQGTPAAWELDVLVTCVSERCRMAEAGDVAAASVFLTDKLRAYRPLTDARAFLRAVHEALSTETKRSPANTQWQRCLAASHQRIGDLLQVQGNLARALDAYRAAMVVRQRLVVADPENADWQRDLAVSHERIGDVRVRQGDLAGAMESYRTQMETMTCLVASRPANADWQRVLCISHDRIGTVKEAKGDLTGAMESYRTAKEIAAHLAASDTENAQWQQLLSVSHRRVGDVLLAQGDLSGALKSYRAAMEIAQSLVASDPGNAQWQQLLSFSHRHVGDVLSAQGDLSGALESYRAAMEIAERLAASDPDNPDWQRGPTVSHNRIGDVLLAQGDLSGALESYRAAMEIARRLAAWDPGNAGWQRDLWVSFWKMADASEKLGQADAAGWWRRAYDVLQSMKDRGMHISPDDEKWLERLRDKAGA